MTTEYQDAVMAASTLINYLVGDEFDPEHMGKSATRMVDALEELTHPMYVDCEKFTTFSADGHDEMIVIQNIQFTTLCAHHVIPFIGQAHVAYIPNELICGLSKIPRAVRYHSRALTVQEKLTTDIADFLEDKLKPLGIAVVMEAEHMCMTVRGVQAAGTLTTTSSMRGVFADHSRQARSEFLSLLRSR